MSQVFKPHPYQLQAIRFLITHPEAALLLDLGLGKSVITLTAIKQLKRTGAVKKVLVIAPLRVCYMVWSEIGEIGKWTSFSDLRVALLHGDRKDETLAKDADIYVINHDGLDWLCTPRDERRPRSKSNKSRLDELIARGVDTLVLDELSKFKNASTKRFKTVKPYLPLFKRRWGLTGSPASNGLLDLFGQAYVLDLGKALGQYITHYRMKYFVPAKYVRQNVVAEWRPMEGAEARIYQALKPLALSMRAEDHLEGMPDLVEQDVWVDLPTKARKFYDEMEAEMIAELDGETHVAGSAGVLSNKCRQIASGGIYLNVGNTLSTDGEDIERVLAKTQPVGAFTVASGVRRLQHVHDAKTEALCELVDEMQGRPMLVGFEYKHDRARIAAALPKAEFIDGSTSQKDSARIIDAWNRGEIAVLCIHPAAAGHGLNLQGSNCSHFTWYTLPWDLDLEMQAVGRIFRQGNKAKTVFVHRILARATVDTVVARALRNKERTQDALMLALRAYAKEIRK